MSIFNRKEDINSLFGIFELNSVDKIVVDKIVDTSITEKVINNIGTPMGIAQLDAGGEVPVAQLPSETFNIINVVSISGLEELIPYKNGDAYFDPINKAIYRYLSKHWVYEEAVKFNKIYICTQDNKLYRWNGESLCILSDYILGETSETAYSGDKGKSNANNISSLQTNKLDKVGDAKDTTVTFVEAAIKGNVSSGDKMSTLVGKISKWFSSLKGLAFRDTVSSAHIDNGAVTNEKVANGIAGGKISGSVAISDTANKVRFDLTVGGKTYNGSKSVAINKADIGLGSVDNTSDINKPVSTLTQNAINYGVSKCCAKAEIQINSISEIDAYTGINKVGIYGFASNSASVINAFGEQFSMLVSSASDDNSYFLQEITTTTGAKYVRHHGNGSSTAHTKWKLVSTPTIEITSIDELDRMSYPGRYTICLMTPSSTLATEETQILIVTQKLYRTQSNNVVYQLRIDGAGEAVQRAKRGNGTWDPWRHVDAEVNLEINNIKLTAVQSATIGGVSVPKSGTTLNLPAYPTTLPASDKAQILSEAEVYARNATKIAQDAYDLIIKIQGANVMANIPATMVVADTINAVVGSSPTVSNEMFPRTANKSVIYQVFSGQSTVTPTGVVSSPQAPSDVVINVISTISSSLYKQSLIRFRALAPRTTENGTARTTEDGTIIEC